MYIFFFLSHREISWKWQQQKCYLASKEDFSLHVFSQDIISLPTSPRLHEAVGHLWPHVFAPVGDKIINWLGDLLTGKQRWKKF